MNDLVSEFTSSVFAPSRAVKAPEGTSGRGSVYRGFGKRMVDLAFILVALPIWLPVIAIGAILAATDGHNPFYRQERVGRGGKTFHIWKLRTMVVNADAKLEAFLADNPEARAEWDATQKLKRDPRVTVIGRILRKTSLDELPQLFNVVSGDMSLVGPRPMMVNQKHLYSGKSYYSLRPGLTGLWQISKRKNGQFADRVRYDNIYAATISLRADVFVLARTVGVILRGSNC